MRFYTAAEESADDLFEDDNVNWRYCKQYASFAHRDACEFILHIGLDNEFAEMEMKKMKDFGCTEEFIAVYRKAHDSGASTLVLYC